MSNDILSQPLHLSRSEIGRFFSKVQVDPNTGCWNWTAGKFKGGYGQFLFRGRKVYAHRLVFAWLEHSLPPINEQELHHVCENPSCVNPSHCELVTRMQHIHKGDTNVGAINGRKTHCPHCGGEYATDANGGRYCLACRLEASKRYREANREYYCEQEKARYWANREKKLAYQRMYNRTKRKSRRKL